MARYTCITCDVSFDAPRRARYCPACRPPTPDAYHHCQICGAPSGMNRICPECYAASQAPCTGCGTPVHTLTLRGRRRAAVLCRACTCRAHKPNGRGPRCAVCGRRDVSVGRYGVCHDCRQVTSTCTICGGEMPKYFTRGGLRTVCSARCRRLINKDIITPEKARAAQAKRFAGYVRKSPANHLARFNGDGVNWRKAVFVRDGFTCQDCGDKRAPGHRVRLQAHHIQPFATHPELRYDVSNGVTLCYACHLKRHGGGFGFGGPVRNRKSRQPLQMPLFV